MDWAVYTGTRAQYQVALAASGHQVSDSMPGRNGVDLLQTIERLSFTDAKVAIDLDGSAGVVAKTLGAVFGPGTVDNAAYAGIGLELVDGGLSALGLMELALQARLGHAATNAQIVSLLYSNVVGVDPPVDDLAYFVGLLDSHAVTPASLGILAANTDLNAQRIGLAELVQSGLEYL